MRAARITPKLKPRQQSREKPLNGERSNEIKQLFLLGKKFKKKKLPKCL